MSETGQTEQPENSKRGTAANFEGSNYEDASWEIIGELNEVYSFEPLEVEVMKGHAVVTDPMFEDLGGSTSIEGSKRWHLPEHLAVEAQREAVEGKEEVIPHIEVTEEQLAALKKEAFEEGRAAARVEVVQEYEPKIADLEKKLTVLALDIQRQLEEHAASIEKQALDLALTISEKIIGRTVEINPEYILPIIKEAIDQSGTAKINKIRVSPEDYEFIEFAGVRKELKEHDGTWDFEADPAIRAGCVVDTSAGEIDFRIDEAWDRVKTNVLKVIR